VHAKSRSVIPALASVHASAKKAQLSGEAMTRKHKLFPNLKTHDEIGHANSEDDIESADMTGDVSVSVVGMIL
jgi:hypothetical protein